MTLTSAPSSGARVTEGPDQIAGRLAAAVIPFFGGVLPLLIRAWDGSEPGPEDAPTVREQGASSRRSPATMAAGVRTAFRLGAVGRPPEHPASQARMGVDQILMVKPLPDGRSGLPRTRSV